MSYIDNAIYSLYNSLSVNCLFLVIAVCEYKLQIHSYNSKITVYKLSVIVLQTICNFTDSLNPSSHFLSSISLKLSITTSYRQLTHHDCTYSEEEDSVVGPGAGRPADVYVREPEP
jgi:hypothetical protein